MTNPNNQPAPQTTDPLELRALAFHELVPTPQELQLKLLMLGAFSVIASIEAATEDVTDKVI
jgi:hypothetical protein